jgi:hypothetical protein
VVHLFYVRLLRILRRWLAQSRCELLGTRQQFQSVVLPYLVQLYVATLFVLIMVFTLNQVEHALNLWAIEAYDWDASTPTKRTPTLIPVINKQTGKVNTSVHAFNERNWGAETRSFLESARMMRAHRIREVTESAYKFSKPYIQGRSATETIMNNRQGELLVDLSSSEEDAGLQDDESMLNSENCKFLLVCYFASHSQLPEVLLRLFLLQ